MGLGKIGLILITRKIYIDFLNTVVFGRQQTCFASLMPKICALVSNFPVIESAVADSITHTTVRSLWLVSLLYGIRI